MVYYRAGGEVDDRLTFRRQGGLHGLGSLGDGASGAWDETPPQGYVYDPFTGLPMADPSGVLQSQGYPTSPADTATVIGENTTQAVKDTAVAVGHAATATYNFVTTAVKWGIIGLAAYAVIEVVGMVPHAKSYGRARVRHYRKRAAAAISRRIAGE